MNNEAIVDMTGGVGYVPLVFSGLSDIDDPMLWMAEDSCWELIDQSVHGKDFWQTQYNDQTGLFDLIYNVNQDRLNDTTAFTRYYLGDNPPSPTLVKQSMIIGDSMTSNAAITAQVGIDSIAISPMVSYLGQSSTGYNENGLDRTKWIYK